MALPTADPVAQGAALLAQGDLAGAERVAGALAAQGDEAGALHLLALVRGRQGRPEEAIQLLGRARLLQPGNVLLLLHLGKLLTDTQQANQGEALLAEGLDRTEDAPLKANFAYHLARAQRDQGKAQAALENFTKVRALDPAGSTHLDIDRANILCELSRPEEAAALLEALVRREPESDAAHTAYNKILFTQRDEKFLASYAKAPQTTALQLSKASLLVAAGRAAEARDIYAALLAREPGHRGAVTGMAVVLGKLGHHSEAVACLETALLRAPGDLSLVAGIAGAALEGGDPQKAAAMAQKVIAQAPHDQLILAVLGSAWRLMGDERDEILNGYDDLIRVFDLDPPEGFSDMAAFNAELDGWLGGLHNASREPAHQSLRAGSQSWGNLFGAGHDLVERLKQRIGEAVERYIAEMTPQERHPFRGRRTKGFRFQESWSSRLRDCGYHVNHIHPAGWISSCYYVGVPPAVQDAKAQQGWIKFGEPGFDIGLKPRRALQPAPGRLVLFPSYMWHGTIAFRGPSTRTTIAFDAVPQG